MRKIGLLTIGQSPRVDITPTFKRILGDSVEILERGALDSLEEADLVKVQPTKDEHTYVSRLRNGGSTKISKEKLLPLLQEELNQLEKEVDLTVMLCTGNFPTIESEKTVLYPDNILVHNINAVLKNAKLGLIIPLERQRKDLLKKWERIEAPTITEVASPYEDVDMAQPAEKLKQQGATMIVLDCMGYSEEHKMQVREASDLPTLLSRSLTASVVKEYLM